MSEGTAAPITWGSIGVIRETMFTVAAMQKGWLVFQATHPQSPYDFVVDTGEELLRVQVKSTYWRKPAPSRLRERPNDVPRQICEVRHYAQKGNIPYAADAWDRLAAVDEAGVVYFIPRAVIGERKAVCFQRGDYEKYKL